MECFMFFLPEMLLPTFSGNKQGKESQTKHILILIAEPNVTFLTFQTKLGVTLLQFHLSQRLAQHPSKSVKWHCLC